ncbi:hypothetical protein [Paraburkholderia sp. BL10I2N1]|uniref:hypothetical protein n=1 Tax=Paraburkholderia sp. BL10I2N1 TaxID=1938796 RepID=UPI00105DDFEE|nr:hypothetical protein [Paraburkholderia sp. BL10I2N1]TDN70459.1 hypothetical protein B0G77_3933 [Paraburkholderia sp. BL10I2N1]
MPYKANKRLPIHERYTAAMVELRLAGANEHVINRFRTLHPKRMRQFLPDIRYMLDNPRLLRSDPPPPPRGWDKV